MTDLRKKLRLDSALYRGKRIYFVTITVADRAPVFISESVVSGHVDTLQHAAVKYEFDVLAYCFMPDHLHILASGRNLLSDLISFIGYYKQITGYRHKRDTGHTLWQKSYYDHILRKSEDVRGVIRYILANPVRKEFVSHPVDYPFSGSFVYDRAIFDMC